MFLQFLDLYGNPVYVRPERIEALRGVAVTWEGRPKAATLIVMTNRETFRVRGLVDAVHDAIVAWHEANTPKLVLGDPAPLTFPNHAVYDTRTRAFAAQDCPLVKCDSPRFCSERGCAAR